jgi:hypothetical protein
MMDVMHTGVSVQCSPIPASRTTFFHRSISARKNTATSCGLLPIGSAPCASDLLAERFGEFLREAARHDVGGAAGRGGGDEADGFGWIIFCSVQTGAHHKQR